jgi:hypothetical protein
MAVFSRKSGVNALEQGGLKAAPVKAIYGRFFAQIGRKRPQTKRPERRATNKTPHKK